MKAFEKWDEKYKKLRNKTHMDDGFQDRYDTWRAALVWALDVCDTPDGYDISLFPIEEELNS